MRVWPHFSQSRTSPLRPFAGHPWRRVQLPHVTAATAVSTRQHAVPIGSVAGAWRLARCLLIRNSRSITAPLDLLRAYTGERVIPRSLRTCPEPCKAVRCWVSPYFKGSRGKTLGCWRETAGPVRTNSWHFSQGRLSRPSRSRIMATKILVAVIGQFLEPFVLVASLLFFVAVVSLLVMRGRS